MDIQQLHDLSKKVIDSQNKVDRLIYTLESLKTSKRVSAVLDLEFDNKRRSSRRFYLSREDLIPIFEKQAIEARDEFVELQKQFKQHTDGCKLA